MYIMDFEAFIIIIVIIFVFRKIFIKRDQEFQINKPEKFNKQEINDLKQRLYNLENNSNIKRIEKRLQAIESIVVDSDYQLNMKFKRELEGKRAEYRNI